MKTEKNFVTELEDLTIDSCGTSYQGEVTATYADLKKHFGKPSGSDEYKVDAEWVIRFNDDNVIATIYNWKDGKNYNGKSGTPKTKITNWHIGGLNENVVKRIESILRK